MRAVIVKSSPTSTGGKVLLGIDIVTNDGNPVALIGMQASCPVLPVKKVSVILLPKGHTNNLLMV